MFGYVESVHISQWSISYISVGLGTDLLQCLLKKYVSDERSGEDLLSYQKPSPFVDQP